MFRTPMSRRSFIGRALLAPAGVLIAACSPLAELLTGQRADATLIPNAQTLAPTPACGDDDDDPTPAQTEGPYFTPNSPERTSLREAGMAGVPLTVSGYVLSTDCTPIANALIDFWQADDAGNYDNVGYTLRGHQFTGADGRFTLDTIYPGLYPGRTRHIHVKVQQSGGSVLTTQLYLPDETQNASDGIYDSRLLVAYTDDTPEAKSARFDFVLAG